MTKKTHLINCSNLMAEWHWKKNSDLKPEMFSANSHNKVWWKCSKGHEWQATIASRNNGCGCPYCSGRLAIKGENDLQTINPNLANEWNYEKNVGLTPEDVTPNSEKKVWWKCSKGHEWQTTIGNRNRGRGCPICSNKKVLQGYNDLSTSNPSLAKEWHPTKNATLMPSMVTAGSEKKVWWKCNKGHEWKATIASRNNGNGCPICDSERHTSLPEYALLYYLKKHEINAIHSYREKGYELDIYIPSMKIAIEYDGYYWHKNKSKKDLEKNLKCVKDGIKLYRIREGLPSLNDSSIDYIVQDNQKDLSKILKNLLFEIIGTSVDIDLKRDNIEIENLREYTEKKSSLFSSNPEVAKEWNYEKNGNLRPENFSASSSKKVWWKCCKGHEWQATIANRNKGNGCPCCSGYYAVVGETDLNSANPNLVSEWNYEKNGDLNPEGFSANSHNKVWWKCKKGHEWQATIKSRNKGAGCPYCSGYKVTLGYNDLQTVNPKLAKEWYYEKNGNLKPENFTANSGKKVWWKCSKGHEWQALICDRNKGRGCPVCSNKKVLKGYNDLATINPKLASEWNYDKNTDLSPEHFSANSGKKVWWKCSKGHEWQATIDRRNRGSGCPVCSSKIVLQGYNDLATLNPKLAKEWHPSKNGALTPSMITAGSQKKVWWKCSKGHEWQATVSNRNNGKRCPVCSKENSKKSYTTNDKSTKGA